MWWTRLKGAGRVQQYFIRLCFNWYSIAMEKMCVWGVYLLGMPHKMDFGLLHKVNNRPHQKAG